MQRAYKQNGFTIVELLIVIVVIAILAAITIVAYNGIMNRTIESSLKADLNNAAKVLENDKITVGNYPGSAAAASNGTGLKTSSGNVLTYQAMHYGYCVIVSNPKLSTAYVIKSTTKSITTGGCDSPVSTVAGSGTEASVDGTGTAAQFASPNGIDFDSSGNAFVSDRSTHKIRKITSSGVVTTFAGSGVNGVANGTGTAAQFQSPIGMAVDSVGNLYVISGSSYIRKITPGAVVTTMNGSGTYSLTNGPIASAGFRNPSNIAVDANGNLYVADTGNHSIRLITPSGTVSTFAGNGTIGSANGTGAAARFNYPGGVAVDKDGTVYVADTTNHLIRKITAAGVTTTLAGSTAGYNDASGTAAQFSYPNDLVVDYFGNVYVTEQDNSHRVRKITPGGVVTTLAGTGVAGFNDATGTASQLNYPGGIALDPNGFLYIADGSNNRIRKIE